MASPSLTTHQGFKASSKNQMRNGLCSTRGAATEEPAGGVQSSHTCAHACTRLCVYNGGF